MVVGMDEEVGKGGERMKTPDFNNMLAGNPRTTIWGIVLGMATYVTSAGVKLPESTEEWVAFGIGLLFAGWGAAQKDSATGSKGMKPSSDS